jgi:hypothetical protein
MDDVDAEAAAGESTGLSGAGLGGGAIVDVEYRRFL